MAIPSLTQKTFHDIYDEFYFACSHGDCLSVERILRMGTIGRTDISNPIGQQKVSAIVVAVEHNHLEVVRMLLNHVSYEDFREVLLLSIYLDLTPMARLIMEHDTFKCLHGTFADWEQQATDTLDDSHFSSVKPIHLAAQYNRLMILYEFLKRGKLIDIDWPTFVCHRWICHFSLQFACAVVLFIYLFFLMNVSKCRILFIVDVIHVDQLVWRIVFAILK
jgi:hypothetical protein